MSKDMLMVLHACTIEMPKVTGDDIQYKLERPTAPSGNNTGWNIPRSRETVEHMNMNSPPGSNWP